MKIVSARHLLIRSLLLILVLTGASLFVPVRAQQAAASAILSGRIEDASGAAVGGASIVAVNLETNQSRRIESDGEGRYRFSYLPLGTYRVVVEREGFSTLTRQLTLTIGQMLDAPLRLEVKGVAASVNVADDLPIVETVRTQIAETVVSREVGSLPLNGRNYLDLALLVPGVSRTNTGSNQKFAETSAVPGTGISVSGQRNLNNNFVVDGLSANDDAADLAGTFYSQEVIREFEVITNGGSAEMGRASSGVVNISTQSGTNEWHGRLYGFLRNQRFDARNPLATQKDPLTQGQYGVSLGGPVRRDQTFIFSNFEQTRRHDAGVVTISPAQATAINQRLDQVGFSGQHLQTGEFPSGYATSNLFARLDHKLGDANLLSAHYNFYQIEGTNGRGVGGLNAVSRGSGLKSRDQSVAVGYVATLSSRTINETRAQWMQSRLDAPINDATGPAVNINGVANFGPATFSPLARNTDLFQASDQFSTERGAHSLKAGADFLYNRVEVFFPGATQGVYTFSSLQNFQAGRYTTFQQAFGAAGQRQSNPNLGLFVQDQWRAHRRLTVNAGLRYEAQFLPHPITTDLNNFAPRVGLAYAPGDGRTVVRASFGIYHDRIPLRATSNALQRDGVKYGVAVLSYGQPGAPDFPGTLTTFPSGVLTSITAIDPRVRNSYSEQASLQIERELPGKLSLAVGYQYLRGVHLLLSRNVNVPTAPPSAGVPNQGRPDPRFANINRYESSGDSSYQGLTASLNRRAGQWASFRLAYTLSKSIDNAGNFFFSSPQDNFNLRDERGLSDNDQRHRLTLSGSFEVPRMMGEAALPRALAGFQLSYIFTYSSPLPFNIQTGTDRNFDTNSNDRPAGVGRNTGRGFGYSSLDLRLSRRFQLTERVRAEAMTEVFNVLNHANLQIPNNIFGSGNVPPASFRNATAAADPRQLQFGLRLSF
ncbi:MAG TPA: carboxypeptidase regulatory-like domain-containing protein [Pyrinomonadaceae bacterium]|nr:carboxypeptidase regulatory-like domain-containing protein [Pyrinomonadaceae bacterium]